RTLLRACAARRASDLGDAIADCDVTVLSRAPAGRDDLGDGALELLELSLHGLGRDLDLKLRNLELEIEVPAEAVQAQLEELQRTVAEVVPAGGRPAQDGDVAIGDRVPEIGSTSRSARA